MFSKNPNFNKCSFYDCFDLEKRMSTHEVIESLRETFGYSAIRELYDTPKKCEEDLLKFNVGKSITIPNDEKRYTFSTSIGENGKMHIMTSLPYEGLFETIGFMIIGNRSTESMNKLMDVDYLIRNLGLKIKDYTLLPRA